MTHVPSTKERSVLQLIENQWNVEFLAPSCVWQYIGSSLYKNLNNLENISVRAGVMVI